MHPRACAVGHLCFGGHSFLKGILVTNTKPHFQGGFISSYTLRVNDTDRINALLAQLTPNAQTLTELDIKRILRRSNKHWYVIRNASRSIVAMGILTIDEEPDHGLYGKIGCVVVDKHVRVSGLGSIVDDHLIAAAKQHNCNYIDLTSSKKAGLMFWLRRGYTIRKTTPFRKYLT